MALFNNPKGVVITLVVFVALLVLFAAIPQCHAAGIDGPLDAPYVQISGGEAVVRGSTQVLDLTFTEPAPQLRHAFWQESLDVVGTSTFKGQSVPNNMIARGLFMEGAGRFDLGIGLSWMLNPAPYNGSNVNFNLQADYRFKFLPVTLTYTHFSNAGMKEPNYGRDLVLFGYRFH
jgi:hypothetical protein